MKMSGITMRRGVSGVFAGCVLGGIATIAIAAPANAAPCTASQATGTISSVSGAASQFLAAHPGADQALTNAASQSPDDARASVRSYFTANPGEYLELKGITRPLVDLQNQCGVNGLGGADLLSAFNEFQNG
ncbi:heme-binding protein [soil metagenome]